MHLTLKPLNGLFTIAEAWDLICDQLEQDEFILGNGQISGSYNAWNRVLGPERLRFLQISGCFVETWY